MSPPDYGAAVRAALGMLADHAPPDAILDALRHAVPAIAAGAVAGAREAQAAASGAWARIEVEGFARAEAEAAIRSVCAAFEVPRTPALERIANDLDQAVTAGLAEDYA